MKWILAHNSGADAADLGGKAAALSALQRARIPIPEWFVVSPRAFTDSLTTRQERALATAKDGGRVAQTIFEARPSDDVIHDISLGLLGLSPHGERVAVRSSAADEDGGRHSFAGQLDSYLFVMPEEVPDRIADVWRSAYSDRVLAYRREHRLSPLPPPPAVLVQRMVDPDVSGIAYSADPVSGDRGLAVIGAVYGVGTSLVSGEADADTYAVDRSGKIVRREIADKRSAHRFDPDSAVGVTEVLVRSSEAEKPALTDKQLLEVAALARSAARFFGRPQDIEWAIENDKLFLLQSRPITSLAHHGDPSGAVAVWDNADIPESLAGSLTPLTFSFARIAHQTAYHEFLANAGVSPDDIDAHNQALKRMLGLIDGHLYYDVVSVRKILALLPGFHVFRPLMEPAAAVDAPSSSLPVLPKCRPGHRIVDAFRFAGLMLNQMGGLSALALRRRLASFPDGKTPLADMRADELASAYRALEGRLLTHWDAALYNDYLLTIYWNALGGMLKAWCGSKFESLRSDLMCGQAGVSADPARRVREMAATARKHPDFVDALCDGSLDRILRAMDGVPAFRNAYESALETFGARCVGELKLESMTLRDDPLPLLRAVGQLARMQDADATMSSAVKAAVSAERRIREKLGANGLHRALFDVVLNKTRASVRNHEMYRFNQMLLFDYARRIFVEIGNRLASDGILNKPRDVFMLEVDEVIEFIEGASTLTDLKSLASLRADEYAGCARREAPANRFETRGIVYLGNKFRNTKVAAAVSSPVDGLKGIACSPGVVRGRVRLAPSPRTVTIEQGDILVAGRTDPGWIILLPAVSGLLVEHGSSLSHTSIVCRELGIPCIVGLSGATRCLTDGDRIEMDGSTGVVRMLADDDNVEAERPMQNDVE